MPVSEGFPRHDVGRSFLNVPSRTNIRRGNKTYANQHTHHTISSEMLWFNAVQFQSETTRDVIVAKQATEGSISPGQEPNLIPFRWVLFLRRFERYAAALWRGSLLPPAVWKLPSYGAPHSRRLSRRRHSPSSLIVTFDVRNTKMYGYLWWLHRMSKVKYIFFVSWNVALKRSWGSPHCND